MVRLVLDIWRRDLGMLLFVGRIYVQYPESETLKNMAEPEQNLTATAATKAPTACTRFRKALRVAWLKKLKCDKIFVVPTVYLIRPSPCSVQQSYETPERTSSDVSNLSILNKSPHLKSRLFAGQYKLSIRFSLMLILQLAVSSLHDIWTHAL